MTVVSRSHAVRTVPVRLIRRARSLFTKTVRNTHAVVGKVLADAERLGLIIRHPAATARPSIAETKEQRTWTSDHLRAFLDRVQEETARW